MTMSGSEDVSVQSGGALKLSSGADASDTGSLVLSAVEGVVNLEAGARLEASAGSSNIRATSEAGILLATSAAEGKSGSLTLSSAKNVDMSADNAAQLSASALKLASDTSTLVQTQGTVALSASQSGGGVDIVAPFLTSKTTAATVAISKDASVQSGGALKLSSSADASNTGSVVLSATSADGVVNLEAGARLEASAGFTSIRGTSEAGILVATSATEGDAGSLSLLSAKDVNMSADNAAHLSASGLKLASDTSTLVQAQGTLALSASESGGGVDIVTTSLNTQTSSMSMSGSEDVSVQSGEALKLSSSSTAASDKGSVVLSATSADGVVNLEAGARLEASAGSTDIRASSEAGILLETFNSEGNAGSLTLSSAEDVDMSADNTAQINASSLKLASDTSTLVQSQGTVALSASETDGGVDIVAPSLTSKTTAVSVSGSEDATVQSGGALKLSSKTASSDTGSVVLSATSADGVVNLEAGARLEASAGSTDIRATSEAGILLETFNSEGNAGSLTLSSAEDVDMSSDNAAQISASSLKLASDTSTLVQTQGTVALSASQSGGGVDIVAPSLTSITTSASVSGSEDVSVQSGGALKLSSSADASDTGSLVLSAVEGVVNLEAGARFEASAGSSNIRATSEAGILLATSAAEGKSGSLTLSSAKNVDMSADNAAQLSASALKLASDTSTLVQTQGTVTLSASQSGGGVDIVAPFLTSKTTAATVVISKDASVQSGGALKLSSSADASNTGSVVLSATSADGVVNLEAGARLEASAGSTYIRATSEAGILLETSAAEGNAGSLTLSSAEDVDMSSDNAAQISASSLKLASDTSTLVQTQGTFALSASQSGGGVDIVAPSLTSITTSASVSGSEDVSVQSGGALKLSSSADASDTGSLVLSAVEGVVNLEAGARFEASAGSSNIRATSEAGILLATSAAEGKSGSLTLSSAKNVDMSADNAAQLSASALKLASDTSTLVQTQGTVALSASQSGGGVDIVAPSLTSITTAATVATSKDASVQSGGALKLSSSADASNTGSVVLSATSADGVVNLEAGARLEASAGSTYIQATSEAGILLETQGTVTLSASQSGGGVDIVAPFLTSKTTAATVVISKDASVQSGGALKLSSSADASNTGSVVLSATSADGVVNLEAGARLEASAGSTDIRATSEAGILLETSAAEGNAGSLTLSSAEDVDMSSDNAAQISASSLKLASDTSTLVQTQGTFALSASQSGGGVDIVAPSLTSITTSASVSGSEDVSVQSGGALKLSSSADASDTGSLVLSAVEGVVNLEAGARFEASAGSSNIRATSEAGILLATSAAEGKSGSLTLSSAKNVDMSADNAAQLSASALKLASDTSTLVQTQGTVALSASQSGGGVDIVAPSLTSITTAATVATSKDASVQSGGALKLSSSADASNTGSVVLSATSADGVVNLEAGARLEASAGSTYIQATSEAGILLETQGTVTLSASQSGGGVDIVAPFLTSKTTAATVVISKDASVQSGGALKLSSSADASNTGSVVLSATSADGVVNLEAGARLEASAGSTDIRATSEAGILLETSAAEGNAGSLTLSSAEDVDISSDNAAQISASSLKLVSDTSTLVQTQGTVALSASQSGGGVDIVAPSLTSITTSASVSGSEDVSVQSGGALKLSSSADASDTGSLVLSAVEGVVNLEAGARFEASAGSSNIRATSEAGILLATSAAEGKSGSLTLSSAKNVDMSADNAAQLSASALKLASDTSTLVQTQGTVALSASQSGGGVDIVAPSLTSKTTAATVAISKDASVQSGGALKLSSSADASNTGSVVLSATSADGVVNLEAGARLEASAGSTDIRATSEAGILLETSAAEGNAGSLTLSSAEDVDISSDNAAQISASSLKLASDTSTLVQTQGTFALSASQSGGGVDIVAPSLTSITTSASVSGSEDVSVQSGGALKLSSSADASDTGSLVLSAVDGVVNLEAGARFEASAGSSNIRATSEAGILLATSAAEGKSGSLTLSSAKNVDMSADNAAQLSASALKLASDTSTLVQAQGTVALSASQSGGGVDIVAPSLTSITTAATVAISKDASVQSGGALKLSSSADASNTGSVVLSATSADGVVNLEAGARLEASAGSTYIQATSKAGILLEASAADGNSGSLTLSTAQDFKVSANNAAQLIATDLKLASDTSTLVQTQGTFALSASQSGGGVDIVAPSLTSITTSASVSGSEDVSVQSGGALKLSSSADASDTGSDVLSASDVGGDVILEAGASLEASAGSTNIRATSDAGILLETSSEESNLGSLTLSSAKDVGISADNAAHLSASGLKLASDTSTLVQSQGTFALSANEFGGGVDIVTTSLLTQTSSLSMSGSEDVSVQSGEALKLSSSSTAASDKGSVVLSATSADGVVNLEAGAHLKASAGSTEIRANSEAGILLVTSAAESNSGSLTLSSAKDVDMSADNAAQLSASALKLASDTSTLVQSQDTVALSASQSGSGLDIVAPSLTSKTTAVSVTGSEDVSVQSGGALKLSSSAAASDTWSVVLSAKNVDGIVNIEAGASLEASAGSTNIRATSEAGILLATAAAEGNSGSLAISSAQDLNMSAEKVEQLSASILELDSYAHTTVQSQGTVSLSASEPGGGVDIVAPSLTSKTTAVSVSGSDNASVLSGGSLKLSSSTAATGTGSVVVSATSAGGIVNLEARARLETSAGSTSIRATSEAGILLATSATKGNSGSLNIYSAMNLDVSADNTVHFRASDMELASDSSTFLQSQGTVALTSTESGGRVDIVAPTLTSRTAAVSVSGSEDVSMQSGGALKLSSGTAASDTAFVVLSATGADGVVNLEAGARLEASAGSTSIRATSEAGIVLATSASEDNFGSLTLSSVQNVNMSADNAAQLNASDMKLASDALTLVQSHGIIALSATESGGGVDVVATALTSKTTSVSVSGSDNVSVQSGGTMKLSSSTALSDTGSIMMLATNVDGVVNVEAGARLAASAGSTIIHTTSEAGILLAAASSEDSSGSLALSSARDVDISADNAAQLSASDLKLASDASALVQSQGTITLSASESSGGVDVVATSLTSQTTAVSVTGSDDVSVQSGGALKLSSGTPAGSNGSVMLSATSADGVVNVKAAAHLQASAGSASIRATSEAGILLATSTTEGKSGSLTLSTAQDFKVSANNAADLSATDLELYSDASTLVQSQGTVALSASEAGGGVDIVATSLNSQTTSISVSGSEDVSVQSSGALKLSSSSTAALDKGSVVLSTTSADGVVYLEAGARLEASAGSTDIRASSEAGILLETFNSEGNAGSLTLSSAEDVDMSADNAAQLSASALKLASDTSTFVQSQSAVALSTSESGGWRGRCRTIIDLQNNHHDCGCFEGCNGPVW